MYNTRGKFSIVIFYKDEQPAAAASRAAEFNAILQRLTEEKRGKVTSEANIDQLYVLGKGAVYVKLVEGDNEGMQAVNVYARYLDWAPNIEANTIAGAWGETQYACADGRIYPN